MYIRNSELHPDLGCAMVLKLRLLENNIREGRGQSKIANDQNITVQLQQ